MSDSSSKTNKNKQKLKIQDLSIQKGQNNKGRSAFSTADAFERTQHKTQVNALQQYRRKLDAYDRQFDDHPRFKPISFETVEVCLRGAEETDKNKENKAYQQNMTDLKNNHEEKQVSMKWKSAGKAETAELIRKLYANCGGVNYDLQYRKKKFFQNFKPGH